MVKAYTDGGWKADAAVLDALAAVAKTADREAINTVVAHIYKPWLRDAAELFQKRAAETPLPGREKSRLDPVSPGTCVLFADGLRYDVGRKFLAMLEGRVGEIELSHQFVALPSVTPTSKPAVSPVASKIKGTVAGEEFRPCVAVDGKDLTPDRFRKLLADEAYSSSRTTPLATRAGRRGPSLATLTRPATPKGPDWPAVSRSCWRIWCSESSRFLRPDGKRLRS